MNDREPTEDELRAAFEEELKRIRVEDVIVQTTVTLVNLAGRRLGLAPDAEAERDIAQAKQAIDGARALLPLLPEEPAAAIREALSQLQLAFAREVPAAGGSPPGPGEGTRAAEPDQAAAAEAERAKARAKLWTPPGT